MFPLPLSVITPRISFAVALLQFMRILQKGFPKEMREILVRSLVVKCFLTVKINILIVLSYFASQTLI